MNNYGDKHSQRKLDILARQSETMGHRGHGKKNPMRNNFSEAKARQSENARREMAERIRRDNQERARELGVRALGEQEWFKFERTLGPRVEYDGENLPSFWEVIASEVVNEKDQDVVLFISRELYYKYSGKIPGFSTASVGLGLSEFRHEIRDAIKAEKELRASREQFGMELASL